MKILRSLALVALSATAINTISSLPTDWHTYIPQLKEALDGMEIALIADAAFFDSALTAIAGKKDALDFADAAVRRTISCSKSNICQLLNDVNAVQLDTNAIITQGNIDVSILNGNLITLRDTTTKIIAELTVQKSSAIDSLATLQAYYDTEIGSYRDLAASFIKEAQETLDAYNTMIAKKQAYLDGINALIARINEPAVTCTFDCNGDCANTAGCDSNCFNG